MLFWNHRILGLEQIDALKAHALLKFGLDPAGPGSHADSFLKITFQQLRWHRLDCIHPVDALLSLGEHAPGDIRSGDFPLE